MTNPSDHDTITTSHHASHRASTMRLMIFIGCAIVVAFAMVVIAMVWYQRSGAAQLDLSRPAYESVRSQIQSNNNQLSSFSSSGPIDATSRDAFFKSYTNASDKIIKQQHSFNASDIDDTELSITKQ